MDSKPGPILPYAIPPAPGAAFLPPQAIEDLLAELESSRATIARQDSELQAAEIKIQFLALVHNVKKDDLVLVVLQVLQSREQFLRLGRLVEHVAEDHHQRTLVNALGQFMNCLGSICSLMFVG